MNAKVLVGGLIGGIVFFLLGWVLYGMLFKDAMNACTTCQRPMESMMFPILGVGQLFFGLFVAYVLGKWSSVSTFGGGAMAGGVMGLLMSIGWTMTVYATSTMYTGTACIIYDILINIVMWTIVGGVVGWWLGRK